MKISGLLLMLSILMFLSSSSNMPLIKFENRMYRVSEETIDAASLERVIGEITEYADEIGEADSDLASNYFPPGTQLYKIKEIPVKEAFAIGGQEQFLKAVYTKDKILYNYILPFSVLVILTTIPSAFSASPRENIPVSA